MKNFNFTPKKFIIFLLYPLLLSIATTLPLAHCRDLNLIRSTCKQTPNYALCVSTLCSNPKSSAAGDVASLTLIMVDAVKAAASDALNLINQLTRKGSRDPAVRKNLADCADEYDAILKADVPVAVEALTKGDYKFAEEGATDAANEAEFCEKGFGQGRSPLTRKNKRVHDLGAVTASMVRILL
ncbi:cell wall / vacuolar inhibitor of fructosidase 1-like [Malania oleifera]|uniref:cell wall / vacuolar inhibitor of fructosidase 1-like n=1 Tax=Malania oleifera TaxID=397392 RepID=UPI0025AEBE99|nr:cell wall / vacuolar inhibitor of fructosidase 1-like [Malania oleifera]